MPPGKKKSLLQRTNIAVLIAFMQLVLLTPTRALAHKMNVFAWVEGDTVFVEGYFPGGKKSQDSLVEVFNPAGTKLLEGRTNKKGEFSFKIPERTDLKIVLTSSMGHKNDFIVPASDFHEVESLPSSPAQSLAESAKDSSAHPTDLSQLEGMIDSALDRKLAPVIKLIRDTRKEGPTIAQIVGGIGYIFGLFGLFMYFKSRKNKERGQRSEVRGQQNIDKQ